MGQEANSIQWDFKPILDLLHALSSESDPANGEVLNPLPSRPLSPVESSIEPASLGDFNRIWRHLGKPIDIPPPKICHESFESSSYPPSYIYSTASSSAPDDVQQFDDYVVKPKEVRWRDEVAGTGLRESRRGIGHPHTGDLGAAARLPEVVSPPTAPTAFKDRHKPRDPIQFTQVNASEFESEPEIVQKRRFSSKRRRHVRQSQRSASADELYPSSVEAKKGPHFRASLPSHLETEVSFQRPPPLLPVLYIDRAIIQPLYTLTVQEKKDKLVRKLIETFGAEPDSALTNNPVNTISYMGDSTSFDGIHVFVDCSNIVIGFYNALKLARNINIRAYIKQPPMSYHSLALIMERGRPVARRVLVGSTSPPVYHQVAKLPNYIAEARDCGYELNILERVMKRKDPTPARKRRGGAGNGYATTSGHSSGSEASISSPKVMAEQGVDEILQMKLLESLVDTQNPSTIVLASGDAAEAEYSGGFLLNVERALAKGWKVELVAWKDGLSWDYRSKNFLRKWEGRFKIIELDAFSEELLAVYATSYPADFQRASTITRVMK